MVKLQKAVVVLLIVTLVLSAVSVVFNIIIFKINSSNLSALRSGFSSSSSNSGDIGLFVEGNTQNSGGNVGG